MDEETKRALEQAGPAVLAVRLALEAAEERGEPWATGANERWCDLWNAACTLHARHGREDEANEILAKVDLTLEDLEWYDNQADQRPK